MQPIVLALLLLQAATPAQQKRVAWVPNPRPSGGWVSDPSHHLEPSTVRTLNEMASSLERETTDEMAVVVVDSTSGVEPADFALALHRAWGVGKGTRDNGIVVLWVPPRRALYVSIGYGLEGRLIDGRIGRIRDEQFFPAFRAARFDEGMLDGVGALIAAAREEGTPTMRIKEPAKRGGAEANDFDWRVFEFVGPIIGVLLALLGFSVWRRSSWRRRHHRCPKCGARMEYLTDSRARSSVLLPAQRTEERLGNVHYDVWRCRVCQARDTRADTQQTRPVNTCPQCHFVTLERRHEVLTPASYEYGGEDLVHIRCAECGYSKDVKVATPRLLPASQSSSSSSEPGGSFSGDFGTSGGGDSGAGGDDFGGGSAGGGGAGGTY